MHAGAAAYNSGTGPLLGRAIIPSKFPFMLPLPSFPSYRFHLPGSSIPHAGIHAQDHDQFSGDGSSSTWACAQSCGGVALSFSFPARAAMNSRRFRKSVHSGELSFGRIKQAALCAIRCRISRATIAFDEFWGDLHAVTCLHGRPLSLSQLHEA